jgi:hypothetical protein
MDHRPINIRQPIVATNVVPRKLRVVNSQQVQDRGVQIMQVDSAGDYAIPQMIRLTVNHPLPDSSTSHPGAETFGLMFAAM